MTTHCTDPTTGVTTLIPDDWPTQDVVIDREHGMIANRSMLDALVAQPDIAAVIVTTIELIRQNVVSGDKDLALDGIDYLPRLLSGWAAEMERKGQR